MLALILAGGEATRLGLGEKALVRLCNRPLISYILDSVTGSGLEPMVLTSPKTPYTTNYCRVQGIDHLCCMGIGYLEDIHEAIRVFDEISPLFTVCTDIPGLKPSHLDEVLTVYSQSGLAACSVWVPYSYYTCSDQLSLKTCQIQGVQAISVGLNIIHAGRISDLYQDEVQILICDKALSFNINTISELRDAEEFFKGGSVDNYLDQPSYSDKSNFYI